MLLRRDPGNGRPSMEVTQADRDVSGANLCRLREDGGLSQQQLADKVGIHRSTISRLETGKTWPTIVTAVAISRVLGVSMDVLLDGTIWTQRMAREP